MKSHSASTRPGFPLAGGFAPRLVSAPAAAHLLVVSALLLSVSVAFGVTVMRGFSSQLYSASRSVDALQQHFGSKTNSPPVAPISFDEDSVRTSEQSVQRPGEDLSESERYALLFMSRQQLARAVAADMRGEDPVPPATTRDYRALAERGLAEVLPGQRWHSLTTAGAILADQLSRWTAKERGIHFIWHSSAGGYTASSFCTCGWMRSFSKNQGHIDSQRIRAIGNHMARVEEQRTKRIDKPRARQRV